VLRGGIVQSVPCTATIFWSTVFLFWVLIIPELSTSVLWLQQTPSSEVWRNSEKWPLNFVYSYLYHWLVDYVNGVTRLRTAGHQQAYCSTSRWYVNVDSHGDDAGWGKFLTRPPELYTGQEVTKICMKLQTEKTHNSYCALNITTIIKLRCICTEDAINTCTWKEAA
jgi:hypothetical protein